MSNGGLVLEESDATRETARARSEKKKPAPYFWEREHLQCSIIHLSPVIKNNNILMIELLQTVDLISITNKVFNHQNAHYFPLNV